MLTFYDFFRSSAAWRVRIAMALKKVPHETVHVHLMKEGGQHRGPAYREINPAERVPVLVDGDRILTQSLAIIEYLEELYPEPALLPRDAAGRAEVRAMAQAIAGDIHPVQNLRVREYLQTQYGQDGEGVKTWCRHWIVDGLRGLEGMARRHKGPFLYGASPTLADCCLVPQIFNLRLMGGTMPLEFGRLIEAESAALALPAFTQTSPDMHPNRD